MKEIRKYEGISAGEAGMYTQEDLEEQFQCREIFRKGELTMSWWEVDRAIFGGVNPEGSSLELPAPDLLRAEHFCDRREMGVINIGGTGTVTVDGKAHELAYLDGLYIGRGSKQIQFESKEASQPAKFYYLSYPAHQAYPTVRVARESVKPLELGSPESANERKLYKVIQPETASSCQLVMGYTQILKGSVWNTMPPHTHERRSEIYCYFDLPEEARVLHLMGEPENTRHIFMPNEAVVMSPIWSIHAGAGTASYSFIWAMGGENQDFTDMDHCKIEDLK